jgi:hypothetical protein
MADDIVTFTNKDLPVLAFPQMEDIRRRGKLCDVTLKVRILTTCGFYFGFVIVKLTDNFVY